jgi:hypothetical protein
MFCKMQKTRLLLLLIIPLTQLCCSSRVSCRDTLKKCPTLSAQEKICFRQPLSKYKKAAKAPRDFINWAIVEYNFFKTIALDDQPKSCSEMANFYTFQLIQELLKFAVKEDSTLKNKENLLLAKCYLSLGDRLGKSILKNATEKESAKYRIDLLKRSGQYFEQARKKLVLGFSYINVTSPEDRSAFAQVYAQLISFD